MFSEMFPGGVYFVGIGGVSMSALARLLHTHGVPVRGSDAQASALTARLEREGIPVHIGESEEISEDTVVCTGAVDGSHPQIGAAVRAGKRLLPRAELLGRIAGEFPQTVSFAGCHGKTTATSMFHTSSAEGYPSPATSAGRTGSFPTAIRTEGRSL